MKALRIFAAGLAFFAIPLFLFAKPATATGLAEALPNLAEGLSNLVDAIESINDPPNRAIQNRRVFALNVVGNTVSGAPLFNVPSDLELWDLRAGRTVLRSNGAFSANLFGLTVGGLVASNIDVAADIFCDGVLVHSTGFFLTNELGDVRIRDSVVMPRTCVAPTVLFVNANESWIAVAGGRF
jgi:hypothetical protein